MQEGVRRSETDLRRPRSGLKSPPGKGSSGQPAPFVALNRTVTTKQAGGVTGGAFRVGPRGAKPPREDMMGDQP
eukprot:1543786-Alexandrium_andersonii.AAC.1